MRDFIAPLRTTSPTRAPMPRRRRQGGFTLLESVLVFALLALAAVGLLALQPQVFRAQVGARDAVVGLALAQGCAERLLAVRRELGYAGVTSGLCNGMGGLGGFAANPVVTLVDAGGATVAACAGATCTATIQVARTSGPAAMLAPLTLQLSAY